MRVLVFESNLMWSARLAKTLRAFGHEPLMRSEAGQAETEDEADVAIINLGSTTVGVEALVAGLHARGVKVLAHAGHKEKELHELGRLAGADRLATNSELTFKLPELLAELSRS